MEESRESVWLWVMVAFVSGMLFGIALAGVGLYIALQWAVFPDA